MAKHPTQFDCCGREGCFLMCASYAISIYYRCHNHRYNSFCVPKYCQLVKQPFEFEPSTPSLRALKIDYSSNQPLLLAELHLPASKASLVYCLGPTKCFQRKIQSTLVPPCHRSVTLRSLPVLFARKDAANTSFVKP